MANRPENHLPLVLCHLPFAIPSAPSALGGRQGRDAVTAGHVALRYPERKSNCSPRLLWGKGGDPAFAGQPAEGRSGSQPFFESGRRPSHDFFKPFTAREQH